MSAGNVHAQEDAVAMGKAFALETCTSCHAVAIDAVNDAAPTFIAIANDPEKTAQNLTAWLIEPHPPMPNLSLTTLEIRNLIAYIRSLKTPD
ncbi:MAG: cytochrome C552 [Alphaproteobacteria bacterium]|nr:cytochrome C552 [Alphaproteobacteria bacterium]